ncbi:hypothetical protein AC578_4817 [Pseudocercospora eumusae]|uniref:Aminotransferase class I/classII large domain-containing protein n=1 Tax=Pseudocercospora eumusae TaxID=321146 RepID=A0A139HLH2_9PEZI|nr:hypothetical protein AC578_4817 [Pseudocercospora eumusae]
MATTNGPSKHLPVLNLQRGWPSTRLCTRGALLQGAQEVLAEGEDMSAILLYGPGKGYPPLCQSIATWLTDVYKPSAGPIDPRRILITNGASASLANIALKYTDATYTRRVFMVEPTYFLACPIFIDCGLQGKLRGIPEGGSNGIDLDFLHRELEIANKEDHWPAEPTLKTGSDYPHVYKYVLYCTTTYSNPSCKTMPNDIRKALVELARKHDILLISDDVYDFLGWSTNGSGAAPSVPPRLVDLDRTIPGATEYGNAISNGSFAKLIGPGIRVGWIEGTPSFASSLGLVGSSSSGGAPSHFASTIVERTLRSGSLQNHIRDVLIPEFSKRYAALHTSIDRHLAPVGYSVEASGPSADTAGGYFTYVRMPKSFIPYKVFAKTIAAIVLRDHNLRITFGHMFVVAGDDDSLARAEQDDGFGYCMRLSWAWHEAAQIEEAIERLATCTKEVLERLEQGEDVSKGLQIGIR